MKARERFGQYRIVRRIASGGFGDVYRAVDTIEGISVALKVPHPHHLGPKHIEAFRKEIRITAGLDHPNILPLKWAGMIEERLVVVTSLGTESLEDRLMRRVAAERVVHYAGQMLAALAYAHERHVVHCDLKPDNLILFPGDRLRLTDFGLAKIALRTVRASGSGTLGYTAPEQAFGKPSPRSDVFSAGLVLYRMLAASLPEWPFEWPYPGLERARRSFHPDLIEIARRATEVDQRRRYADATAMRRAFEAVLPRALDPAVKRRRAARPPQKPSADWRALRQRQFQREHGRELGTRHACKRCGGPVAEAMTACPWCGTARRAHSGASRLSATCPRCKRGVRGDWRFCPYCWGAAIGPLSSREHHDPAYVRACRNPACARKELLPFMRYCPWCRRKVQRAWPIPGTRERCPRCSWGVVHGFWEHCPWCASRLPRVATRAGPSRRS